MGCRVDTQGLSSLLYEAAIVPERWLDFVEQIASEVSAFGAVLFTTGTDGQRRIVGQGLAPVWQDFASGGWNITNPRLDRVLQLMPAEFVRDTDVLTANEIATHPWFTDFCAKWDMGQAAGTCFALPSGTTLVLSIERHTATGEFSDLDIARLNSVRADLGRAAELGVRLSYQQYESQTRVLNAIGLPGAVIDRKGRLLSANALFETMMPQVVRQGRDRLQLSSKPADALMAAALERLDPELWIGTSASIAIPATVDAPSPAILHMLPIRGLAHDILSNGACLMVISKLDGSGLPAEMLLRNLFDLSAAEARVARSLVGHRGDYANVARDLGLSIETVRTHAKAVYRKTGLVNAADLVAMGVQLGRQM